MRAGRWVVYPTTVGWGQQAVVLGSVARVSAPFSQASYHVRFEWGPSGLARLAPAGVVVIVDVLGAGGAAPGIAALQGGDVQSGEPVVLLGGLRNAAAVARRCLEVQLERGERTSIAVIALADGDRFTVENLLGAGAVIAALAELGIDHTSPEAAAACEAAIGLRRAYGHLVSASGSGRALAERAAVGEASAVDLRDAAELDASDVVPELG